MLTKFIILCTFLQFSVSADTELDLKLKSYIDTFQIKAVSKPVGLNEAKFILGEKLFFDEIISGNKNISCSTCHDSRFGSADSLPVPIGEGGKGIALGRVANSSSQIVARNSPALYNLGHKDIRFLFWDGRIHYRQDWDIYTTPSEVLNGDYPKRNDITEVLGSALAAQALFPILSREEMRGQKGSNDIADAQTDELAWKIVMSRLMEVDEYIHLFKKAYPGVDNFNIGHFGNALGHYQKHNFTVFNTPWDNYLRGQNSALSKNEKLGALTFFEDGMCIRCHTGSLFGSNTFKAVAAPQVGPGKDIHGNDEGRFLISKRSTDRYKFRVPPLRNVALTAPYFHSGTYSSLSEVIEHYRSGGTAIDRYDSSWLDKFTGVNYPYKLFVETNRYMIFKKKEAADTIILNGMIDITDSQKDNLLLFLESSLTDTIFTPGE